MTTRSPSRRPGTDAVLNTRIVILSLLSVVGGAGAQPVLISPPVAPRSWSQPAPSPAEGGESGEAPGMVTAPYEPLQWRRLTFRPHVSYELLYGTGIQFQTNKAKSTIVQTITPGMAINIGELWTFDYTPSIRLYSDSSFHDSLNHSLSLNGHTSYEDWTFGLGLGMGISSDPIAETGQQTDQQSYSATLSVGRQLNASLSMDLSASLSLRLANKFVSSRTYSTMNWLNQQVGSSISIGLGLGGGYDDVDKGTDMTFEQLQGRIQWKITDKSSLSLNAGPEIRQFVGSDKSSLISPVFGGTYSYQLFQATSLNLSAIRSIGASYFRNQLTTTTSISAGLTQRFLQRYNFGLSAGYSLTSYEASANNTASGREDTNKSLSVSVGRSILERGSVSAFYSISENSSGQSGFAYSSNQMGLNLSYSY